MVADRPLVQDGHHVVVAAGAGQVPRQGDLLVRIDHPIGVGAGFQQGVHDVGVTLAGGVVQGGALALVDRVDHARVLRQKGGHLTSSRVSGDRVSFQFSG